jgi:hypothetical protein
VALRPWSLGPFTPSLKAEFGLRSICICALSA